MPVPGDHEKWMRRALELARRGEGLTRPNPPVGAVIVRGGKAVGEGYHRKAGGPHAEAFALKRAGAKARGATLYVSLEPCSTWGKTPPCTDAIIEHGIRTVVVGARDPNPRHAGRGLALLRKKGIKVIFGVCEVEASRLIKPFDKWIKTGLPFITLKLGITADGRIADAAGRSKWITGAASRRRVHDLRRRVDGIMVGGRTARRDNPSLLPVPSRGRRPVRIIAAGRGPLPKNLRVRTDRFADQTLIFGGRGATVPVKNIVRELGHRGLLHVDCEGGGEFAASLVRAGLVDEIWLFVAPMILGGGKSVPSFGGKGWGLAAAPRFRLSSVERMGEDVLICLRPV